MAKRIEDLLHRRSDLSTFLVHFTSDYGGKSANENILNILQSGVIEARNAFGSGQRTASDDDDFQASQHVVCFTETPLEHAWMMCEEIEGRVNGFSHYALAFTKAWARSRHANPVWYVDISTRGGADWLMVPIHRLRDDALAEARRDGKSLADFPIAKILPYVEQMGPMTFGGKKEWWWEREWRHSGDFYFEWTEVVAIFAPVNEHDVLRNSLSSRRRHGAEVPPILDPEWGLERMISALRGIPASQAGPWPVYY
jgi:hypothetical protein